MAGRGPLLVTGGAGYVGGFTVRALVARGEEVVVLDDLSEGHRSTVPDRVPLLVVDLRDQAATRAAVASRPFRAVLHFAANAYVGESVRDPRKYWENNVGATLNLLSACVERGIDRFVQSSSCTVYGRPEVERLSEELPLAPVSPYGRTKATVERILEDYASAGLLRSFRLRYFNAAGADREGTLGEAHDPETHLVPLTMRAALTGRPLSVFGVDWPTPDGSCVRDYVHVEDLARAHAAAVAALDAGHEGAALNLGTGRGVSVLEVIRTVEQVSGLTVPWNAAPRRPGDPASLVAARGRAEEVLGWKPRHTEFRSIAETAWAWHHRREA